MKKLLVNWKTSSVAVAGAILVILNLIYPKTFTTEVNTKITGALVIILGVFSKDFNVTGGTTANVPNDASVVANTTEVTKQ